MGAMVAFECEYRRVETTHGTYPRGVPLAGDQSILRLDGMELPGGAVGIVSGALQAQGPVPIHRHPLLVQVIGGVQA